MDRAFSILIWKMKQHKREGSKFGPAYITLIESESGIFYLCTFALSSTYIRRGGLEPRLFSNVKRSIDFLPPTWSCIFDHAIIVRNGGI
jgi:hypothetical protein